MNEPGKSRSHARRASGASGPRKNVKAQHSDSRPGSRRKARIIAFQSLYRWDLSSPSLTELLDFSWIEEDKLSKLSTETIIFARLLIQGTLENLPRIDQEIRAQLENWDFTRLARVDLAILRMGAYCLLFQSDIPPTVTIDEAVDISKEFGAEDSYRFVNGVLDGIRKRAGHGSGGKGPEGPEKTADAPLP